MISRACVCFVAFCLPLGWLVCPLTQAQDLSATLRQYLETVVREHHFSGAVIVTKDGTPLIAQGYGLANIEQHVPNTPQTIFRIWSLTKPFTAMAILMLQEQGHLSVHAPLATYLPHLPKAWETITLHQLLTHTSGIMHSWALPGFRDSITIPATLEETIARFKDQPLVFAPGEGFQYSGVGYFLLAEVIAKVAGHPYEIFVKQALFEPLGMHHTGADQPSLKLPQRASGYMRKGDTLASVTSLLHADIHMPIFTGGGNLYSTVEDLARWDQALAAGKLLSRASYRLMYTPVKQNYAYGWVVHTHAGRQEISHEGGGPGFHTYMLRVPEQRVCVIVCSNVLPMPVERIASNLAALVFGEPLRTE